MKTLYENICGIPFTTILMMGFIFLSHQVEAAPLKFVPQTIKQPSGEVIHCFVSGDEFFNWLHDKDGYTIVSNESGYYVYAVKDGGQLLPTNHIVGKSNPAQFGLEKWAKPDQSVILEQVKAVKRINDSYFKSGDVDNFGAPVKSQTTGNLFNLVVFIRFADDAEFSQPINSFSSLFNNSAPDANSVQNYYQEVSYGQLNIYSSFYPASLNTMTVSYKDSHIRNYYTIRNASNPYGYTTGLERTEREHNLLENAINAVKGSITNADSLDGNNDGNVDNVCFIVKGSIEFCGQLLWPHMWSLESRNVFILGKKVTVYNFQLEHTLFTYGVGVLSHEFFHSIGAPDLYHYSYDGVQPVAAWDLMESSTNPPQHMNAYMKFRYGHWIDAIPEIADTGIYSLQPLISADENCYKISSPNSSGEYFVVEYRKRQGIFESSLPDDGLLVYRINNACNGIGNNFGPPDEVYLYRPQGSINNNGTPDLAALSSNSGRNAINDNTDPFVFLSNGLPGGLDLYDIGAIGDSISFKMHAGELFTLNLTDPTGGENFKINTQTNISWSNSGISTIIIEYSTNGAEWTFIDSLINQASLYENQYLWTLPDTLTTTARVRISDAEDARHFSMSKSNFSISTTGQLFEIEPNNTANEANLISLGDKYEGEISMPEDVDYYKFTANAGDTIDVFANAKNSILEGRIIISNANGTQNWISTTFYENSKFKQRFSLLIPETGEYFIRYAYRENWGIFPNSPIEQSQYELISNITLTNTGKYELTLKEFEPSAPYFEDIGVLNLTLNSGRLFSVVRTQGAPTYVTFEYGLTPVYGNTIEAMLPNPYNIMSQPWGFEAKIDGLTPNTTYHYRSIASNSWGIRYSRNSTFTTALEPTEWERQIIPTDDVLHTYMSLSRDTGITFKTNLGFQMFKTNDGGKHWELRPGSPQNDSFMSGTFVNDHSIWVVGADIAKTTDCGLTWQEQIKPVNKTLCSVSFVDENNGIAVGYQGAVITTDNGGNTWVVRDSGTVNNIFFRLRKVQLISINRGFAAGDYGTILRTNDGGISWDTLNCGYQSMLNNLFFLDSLNGYVVGDGRCGGPGDIIHTTDGGNTWISQNNPTGNYLHAVDFYDSNHGIIAGINGAIAVTHDGGNIWIEQESGVRSLLRDVKFIDSTIAVIVGDGGIVLKSIDLNTKNIVIKSPIGNEVWQAESVQNVIWQKNNVSQVNILYSTDALHELWDTIAINVPASITSYRWLIPDTPSENCLVRISDANNDTIKDFSDNLFTIFENIPATITLAGTLTPGQPLCYNATETINVAGNGTSFIVNTGGIATMIAGQVIHYLPGTKVEPGGYMWGYISPGGPWCLTPSMPAVVAGEEEPVPLISEKPFFKVYPNPTTGKLVLELTGFDGTETTRIEIYGMQGDKILSKELKNERKHEFSLSAMPVGVYFIRVISGNKAETVKIIKQ